MSWCRRGWWSAVFVACQLGAQGVGAQVIVVAPLVPSGVPVNHPVALLLAALGLGVMAAWCLRSKNIRASSLRSGVMVSVIALSAVLAICSDAVHAQVSELQRYFSRQDGESQSVPVQPGTTAPDGDPLSFLPVVYTNQTSRLLQVRSITTPTLGTCFPLGIPASLPASSSRPDTPCVTNATLAPGASCWVDVAQLCAAVARGVLGSAPSVLQPDLATVQAGAQAVGNVLANDTDADGPLTVSRFRFEGGSYAAGAAPSVTNRGVFSLRSDGAFSFDAAADFLGSNPLVVTYTTQTGSNSTLRITVTFPNRSPVANEDLATTSRDTATVVAVRANDVDPDNDVLTVARVTTALHGTVVIDGVTGNPVYTPNAGFIGTDTFTYTVEDGRGGSSTATVTVTVAAPANAAPVAVADSMSVAKGGTVTTLIGGGTSLLANDSDPDGDAMTASLVTGPAHGTLTLNANGTFSYTHDGTDTPSDSFTYKANDGALDSTTATVGITVRLSNSPPVAVDDFLTTPEDTPLTIDLAYLVSNDFDVDGDPVVLYSAGSVVNGSLGYVGGRLVFTPSANFNGQASFTYGVHDGQGHTDYATVHITVVAVDDPSVIANDTLTLAEDDGTTPFNVLSNDSDVDDVLSIVSFLINNASYAAGNTASLPGIGSLTLQTDGSGTFSPAPNYHGIVPVLTYTTNTGASGTLTITVTPVNDPPVAIDDTLSTPKNTLLEIALPGLLANDTDIDGDVLSVIGISNFSHGTLNYIGGNLYFTPELDYTGMASFQYTMSDNQGGTASAVVYISVY